MSDKRAVEFGDQRAKDIIDVADEEPDPHRAIELLKRALEYGRTGLQAAKAFGQLGGRYEELGEVDEAIACYTQAINVGVPSPYDHFWRGRLWYGRGEWENARQDFERALSLEHFWSPERDEAQQYLAEIERKVSDQQADLGTNAPDGNAAL